MKQTAVLRPPLVPEDVDSARSLSRAAYAVFAAQAGATTPAAMCEKLFPRDAAALAVTRAAVSGASTTGSQWLDTLYNRVAADFFLSLTASAASRLIQLGTIVPLTGIGPRSIPIVTSTLAAAPWVGEGGAIPLGVFTFGAVNLDPRKMALIVVASRELVQLSGAAEMFDRLLRAVGALSLDAAYFSTSAGSASAHQGLLFGLSAGTGSSNMEADLSALAAAVSGPGASGQVVFVAAPGRAATTGLSATLNATILASSAVPADRVIAVDPLALVHGFGDSVEILTSPETLIHMSDTPLNIATGAQGSGVLATPTQSMFQTAQSSARVLIDISFAKMRPGCVAFANGCTW